MSSPVPTPPASDGVEAADTKGTSSEKDPPADSSAAKPLSFVKVDAGTLRNIILEGNPDGDSAAAPDASATTSKKKKKKKRQKSAQESSSSASSLSNPPTPSGMECGRVDGRLTDSLHAMSMTDASPSAAATAAAATAAAAATTPQAKEAKRNKKKKKQKKDRHNSGQSAASDAGSADVEMKDVVERESPSAGEQKEPQGMDQAAPPNNLQRLTQNLFNKQRQQQQQMPSNAAAQEQIYQMMPHMRPHHHGQPQTGMQGGQQQQQEAPQGRQHHPGQKHQHQHQHQQHRHQHHQHQHQHHQHQHQHQNQHQQGQRGNNSPHHKHQHKKQVFEQYWSQEDVAAGLKRGTLIQGSIRINPKNYEDAYLPLPDGTADIYISGMTDRNRALNGDEVAVLLGDRDSWRVFTDEVNDYEKCNTPQRTEEGESGGEGEAAEPGKGAGKDASDKAQGEDPDVLVEEEEEVDLDSSGKPIESTLTTNPVTGTAAAPVQTASTSHPPTPATQEGGGGSTGGGKGARPKDTKGGTSSGKTQGSSCKAKQRYTSVKEMMDQGSPVVRKLFDVDVAAPGGGGGEEDGERKGLAFNADRFMQRTGRVVAIVERRHSRASSGSLRPMQDSSHNFALFAPNDSRVPRIMIPTAELPQGFKERPEDFARILFIARITDWNETSRMPRGTLAKSLGEAGQLEPETEAILLENNIDTSDFSDEVLACLPEETPWTIPREELQWRRDLRKECVFTIDPSTARDLDDALHCTDLGDGVYEVGVHIADVSYFVDEGTELDKVAKDRATSVYLVQKVIPMLPRLLCEQLCSLNPDEDRLSFSVIWKLTQDGEILEEWFGRTVIRSCVKLSYDHAQGFIEEPDREWTREELPPISEGFTVEDIRTRVLQMDKIAKALRQARFDSGALRLDQVKLQFTLNKESALPNGYFVYQQRDSNKLVEEFMLLANMAVAHKIRREHREKAVLRRHPPPQSRMINDLKELCGSLGFPIEVNTAKDIQLSLLRYIGEDDLSQARLQILVALCSRPMRNAKYFCCGMLEDEQLYGHYALNVPLYTHFTSPIRRYPDILVHRTLAASLGYCPVTPRHAPMLQQIADHCNTMKTNAKQSSERSNELYFAIFVKEAGPLEEKGMVMQVLDKSFDVFILRLGVVKRVYCERLPLERFHHQKQGKKVELTLVWKGTADSPGMVTQRLAIFTPVSCVLQAEPEPLRWSAFIHRPVGGDVSIVG
ncbi:hypothetical protein ACOMHN_000321 [Nucella lapillus]